MTNSENDQDKIRQILKSQPPLVPPESFYQGVWRRIETSPTRRPWWSWGIPATTIASACVVMLVVFMTKEAPIKMPEHRSKQEIALTNVDEVADKLAAPKPIPAQPRFERPFVADSKPMAKRTIAMSESPRVLSKEESNLNYPVSGITPQERTYQLKDVDSLAKKRGSGNFKEAPGALAYGGRADSRKAHMASQVSNEWRGNNSDMYDAKTLAIQKDTEWQALWREHAGSSGSETPEIDFNSHTVVAVFSGQKNTGGYRIEIVDIRTQPDEVVVFYHEFSPAPDDMTTQALTSPFHIKVIPKNTLPIRFKKI